MAENFNIVGKVVIDNSGSVKSINDLKNSLNEAKKAQAEMVKQFGEGSKEAEEAAKAVNDIEQSYLKMKEASQGTDAPIKSLKQQLKEANAELIRTSDEFGATSKEAANAAKKVAEIKDKIGDAKLLTDAFNPDAKFKGMANAIQGAAGAFSALQGAQALFGSESKKLEETLVKVQGAMALSQGLNSVLESKDAFIALGTQAKTAFQAIKAGIGSTGIGVLLLALGAIVAYWDDIKAAVGGVSAEQKKLSADAQKNLDAEKKKLDAIDSQSNILKLQGKSEKDILNMKIKQYDQTIAAAEVKIKIDEDNRKREQAATERNYKLLKSYIDFVSLPLNYLYKTFAKVANAAIEMINKVPGINIDFKVNDKLVEEGADMVTKFLFDPEATKKEGEKTAKEANDSLTELKNNRAGALLQMRQMDQEEAKKRQEQDEKNKQIALETQKIHQEAMLALMTDGYIKQKEQLNIQHQEELEQIDIQVKKKELTEEQANERRKALEEKYSADLLALQTQEAERRAAIIKDITDKTEKVIQDTRLAAITDGYTKQQIVIEQAYQEQIDATLKQQDSLNNAYKLDKNNLDILLNDKKISQDEYNASILQLDSNLSAEQKALNDLKLANEQKYLQDKLNLTNDYNKKTTLDNINKQLTDLEETINANDMNFAAKKEALDKEQSLTLELKNKGLISEKEYNDRMKKFAKEREDIGKAEVANKKAQLAATAGLLNQFADLVGKQTKAGRAAAIAGLLIEQGQKVAEIVTNTQSAVMKDVAASPLTSGLPWAAIHVAQGALGVATSIKAVKKGISDINSAGSSESGGGSVGSAEVGTAPSPVPPLPPQASTTALPQEQINQLTSANAAVKAYVVESDVSNGQERITRINRAARIS